MIKRFLGVLAVVIAFTEPSLSSPRKETGFRIIRDVLDRIYCISESSGNPASYEQALTEARQRMESLMKREDYDPAEDKEEGVNALQMAARLGHYSIVESILAFDKGKALIESEDPLIGFTSLELAKLRVCELEALFEPLFVLDIPYIVNLPFYCDFQMYDKTIEALKKQGAKERASTKELWTRFLEKQIEHLSSPEKAGKLAPGDLEGYLTYFKESLLRVNQLDSEESTIETRLKALVREYFGEKFKKPYPYPR